MREGKSERCAPSIAQSICEQRIQFQAQRKRRQEPKIDKGDQVGSNYIPLGPLRMRERGGMEKSGTKLNFGRTDHGINDVNRKEEPGDDEKDKEADWDFVKLRA